MMILALPVIAYIFMTNGLTPNNRLSCTCMKEGNMASGCINKIFLLISGSSDLGIGSRCRDFYRESLFMRYSFNFFSEDDYFAFCKVSLQCHIAHVYAAYNTCRAY